MHKDITKTSFRHFILGFLWVFSMYDLIKIILTIDFSRFLWFRRMFWCFNLKTWAFFAWIICSNIIFDVWNIAKANTRFLSSYLIFMSIFTALFLWRLLSAQSFIIYWKYWFFLEILLKWKYLCVIVILVSVFFVSYPKTRNKNKITRIHSFCDSTIPTLIKSENNLPNLDMRRSMHSLTWLLSI